MLRINLLIGLFLLSLSSFAQSYFSIKGILVDVDNKKPISNATVKITAQNDTSFNFSMISNDTGYFQFSGLQPRVYFLFISSIGYDSLRQAVIISDTSQNLGIVGLYKRAGLLNEVTVNGNVPPVRQKGDTVEYNASSYKVNPDATTEDLIKKMPGITVDKQGTVTAHGETVQKVTVDGKDFFGDDAAATLKNLPAEIIDKIQVFDRMSDQAKFTGFDDGNSVKAINIITKNAIKNGQFGRLFAGYGTDERYSTGGNVSFFNGNRRISLVGNFNNINQQNFGDQDLLGVTNNGRGGRGFGGGNFGGGNRGNARGGNFSFGGFGGGENFTVGQQSGISNTNALGINYSDKWSKKIDVTGSYFFNNANNTNDQLLKSQTTLPDGAQFINQQSITSSKNYNHRFNMRMEYKIDSSNSLIITPSLNFQKNNSTSNSIASGLFNLDTTSTSNVNTRSNRDGYNLRNNILYRHSFAKKGRTLSVNLNTTFNKNDGETTTAGDYRFFDGSGTPTDSIQNQFTTNPTNGYTVSSNIAYTEPLGKKSQLQVNYSPSYSKNKANQQTFLFDAINNKYFSQPDTSLSNKFDNTTTVHNGGLTYRLSPNKDNQFSVGVNFQHSELESNRLFPIATQVGQSFTTFLPNLMWRKKISTRSSLNIFYRANTSFPSVTQLQDVLNITNPLRISMGNPDLKQSYSNFISGRYTFTNTMKGQSFFANLFLLTTDNYISNATYIAQNGDSVINNNTVLKLGSTLSKPVNLNGYKSLRSFFTFSQPIKLIKSNLNLSTGFTYSNLPGLSNNSKTITKNYVYNAGIVIASNISEYVDFNLSYNVNFNNAKLSTDSTTRYTNQVVGIQFNLLSKTGWFLQNDISGQSYNGLSADLDQSYWLWNAAIGKKFLKSRQAELKLSVFDLLKQNQSITRTVSENYIEDVRNQLLQQYFMLTFTYKLKNFGQKKKA